MSDRYGKTRVTKIRAAYGDLRRAVRSGDLVQAQDALDRYEQWAGFALGEVAAYQQGQRDMQMDADVAATEAIVAIILDDVAGKPFSLNSIHQRIQTVIRDLPIREMIE